MNKKNLQNTLFSMPLILILILLISGCAPPPKAPDFTPQWEAFAKYSDRVNITRKRQQYIYQVLNIDLTLADTLTRWAKDSNLTFTDLCDRDFSIVNQVIGFKARSLNEGLSKLRQQYEIFGVKIHYDGRDNLQLRCPTMGVGIVDIFESDINGLLDRLSPYINNKKGDDFSKILELFRDSRSEKLQPLNK